MLTKTAHDGRGDYFALVEEFPLVNIRNDEELAAASAMVDRLLRRETLSEGAEEYLDVLSDIIEKYETEHHPIEPLPDHVVLAQLLTDNRMSQAEFARRTEISPSTVSAVVAGERKFTRNQLGTVAALFNVSPSLFSFEGD